jgi:hypothetical protein
MRAGVLFAFLESARYPRVRSLKKHALDLIVLGFMELLSKAF